MKTIDVQYTPHFVRLYQNLEGALQEEVKEKIALFRNRANHHLLKVHKLHGRLKGNMSFSVNYRYRIVFEYLNKNTVILKAVRDHEVYG